MRLRVVDIETTGTAPPAEIIEFGFSDVVLNPNGVTISEPISWLYRPLGEIPPETKAVHHLTEEDFPADIAPATPGHMRAAITFGTPPHVLVAHNCVFERLFLPTPSRGDCLGFAHTRSRYMSGRVRQSTATKCYAIGVRST